jgi:hypothetical protein
MKSCFVIPTYPFHYNYLSFLDDLPEDIDFDIYFVLSFHSDLEELKKTSHSRLYKTIVLEDHLSADLIRKIIDKKIIVTFKKYYALNILKKEYDYLATCDSEIKFVDNKNITDKFKMFCDNKKIIGASVSYGSQNIDLAIDINKESTKFFDYNAIEKISDGFRFYFWFSDIPIYDSRILIKYLDYIKFSDYEKFIDSIDWYFFDYISYGYYCLIYEGYEKINTMDYGIGRNWSLESIDFSIYEKVLNDIKYKPLWLIHNTWKENEEKLGDEIILAYHLNDGRYTTL